MKAVPESERMLQRARQSLEGLSIGDAFGERFFMIRGELLEQVLRERVLPRPPPWRFTDDTVMALSLYEVLAKYGHVDQDALAAAFARRYIEDPACGYGAGAHEILQRLAIGEPWQIVSPSVFNGAGSLGNGGAMRVAPLGAYFASDLARAASEARASAEVTHAHPEGQAGAIAIAVAAAWVSARVEQGQPPGQPIDTRDMFAAVLAHTPEGATRRGILRASEMSLQIPISTAAQDLGSGSRVTAEDTVPFCLWCAARHIDSYEDALWAVVSVRGDIDTNCAIVGGIVACATDPESIPAAWRAAREPLPLG
jgi:ADP-ribosylglycohydrolase